ncbi:unnamed protein product [Haemonchus placei]|uniref:Protein transport protein sec16 n=1 Tax=Haemonchus placei TaxID=6290 RepID=A0A0N4W9Z9_HAEPC|nr:unnamed protein product [Haemonchus placei]
MQTSFSQKANLDPEIAESVVFFLHIVVCVFRFQRAGGRYGHYDTYDDAHSSVSEESDSDNAERGESEEEIRNPFLRSCAFYFDFFLAQSRSFPFFVVVSVRCLFVIVVQARVRSILTNFPPPVEYHRLPPIEKAAYLFFVAVYKKQYNDIGDFHRKFNREYYKYTCDGDSDDIALWKVSQRASMDDNHDDRTSDILSIDSSQRGNCFGWDSLIMPFKCTERIVLAPLKHRVPHAFVSFGPGGKMVTVHPDLSVSVVQIDDIKAVVSDPYTTRLIDSAQTFKGPLLIGQTPTHSVRLYIERQIKRIKNSEVASENPHANDVIDCLLIWQLLGTIVQQQGRVTGPDVAATPVDSVTTTIMDARAYERFTELLLGGHIVEAIDSALRDGLYADAMVLARRLLAHDAAKLAEIEERFIATRSQCSPVVTLVSVSSKKLVPILMNPTGDESGSWRTHAAIILANLTTSEAMETVYDLGKALAKREYNCAADFCFLAVSVLAGINPFAPIASSTAEGETRQHINLIHSFSLYWFRFSLVDLHATEIFDYAVRLSDVNAYSPLGESIEYQRKRIQYAHLIAEFGGFATDAFKYCMEIARSIWNYYHLLSTAELTSLCDLADRLRYAASASEWETSWIASMRSMIQQKQQYQAGEITQSASLTSEARDWHAQRQDPLQMSSMLPRSVGEENDERVSRSRTVSNASQQGRVSHEFAPYLIAPLSFFAIQKWISFQKSSSSQGAKGFLSNIKEKLLKSIPSGNEMILPDDSKPTIVWDPVKGRYVGAGVEEETTAAPPPKMDGVSNAQSGSSGGLRAARTSGGNIHPSLRLYTFRFPKLDRNIEINLCSSSKEILSDDAGESVDPFSGQANPTIHGVELTQAQ